MCIETLTNGRHSYMYVVECVLMELKNIVNGLVDTALLDALKQVRERRKRMNNSS